jgi:uncharacterized protein (TIGR02117 family)
VAILTPKLRWTLRLFGRLCLGLVAFVLLYAALAFALPRIPVNSEYEQPEHGLRAFVESNGVHTDFVVPIRSTLVDWTEHFPLEWFEQVDPTFEYISFGWGDKGFYLDTPTWRELTFSTAFKAVFFLGSSAVHVTYYRYPPLASETCRRLPLTDEQYKELIAYVLASFQRDEDGRVMRIDHAGYTPCDRFFEGKGKYSLVHTCNSWTGSGLDEIGVKTGLWTPFAWDVLRFLEE